MLVLSIVRRPGSRQCQRLLRVDPSRRRQDPAHVCAATDRADQRQRLGRCRLGHLLAWCVFTAPVNLKPPLTPSRLALPRCIRHQRRPLGARRASASVFICLPVLQLMSRDHPAPSRRRPCAAERHFRPRGSRARSSRDRASLHLGLLVVPMLMLQIEATAEKWGVAIESILLKDINFSVELQQSLSSAATQKRIGESKVIAARAEVDAAKLMRQAADVSVT